jgi:dTMP kinase
MTGRLIVFEGPDGAGKTTIARGVAHKLRIAGDVVVELSFPGRIPGSLGSHVYALHHAPHKFGIRHITPEALQALHVAAHLDTIDNQIRPQIAKGATVLLDRYWWSTLVYGLDANGRAETVQQLVLTERKHWGDLLPSFAFLIVRQESLRDDESGESWRRRLDRYQNLALEESSKYSVQTVSNDGPEGRAVDSVIRTLSE